MKDTIMYEAVMITSTNIGVLQVSNSKKQLKEFIRGYINTYLKNLYSWDDVKSLIGENSYTILRRNNNEFIFAFNIRKVACIIASSEELEEEKKERDKTAKNAE